MELHESRKHPWCTPAVERIGLRVIFGLALGALAVLLGSTGCARNSPAEADLREVRVTTDGAVKKSIRFSPDGKWIAYGALVSPEKGLMGLYVLPRAGGQARKVSPDTLGVYPLEWTQDGRGVLCGGIDGRTLYRIGLDGSVQLLDRMESLTRVVDISPDGRTELALRFHRDNRDLGIRPVGGDLKFLADTPEWEDDASFGPGPGEVTAVSLPSYMAPVTTINVWSPKTGRFTPLPLPDGQKYQPAWAPDGSLMAYTLSRDGRSDLWVYDARAGSAVPLAEGPDDASSPAWSPDGGWLAFCRSVKSSHIYAGDPRKPGQRELTSGRATDYSPAVSPDGRWIAFLRRMPASGGTQDRGPSLCVMPASGGQVKELELKGLSLPVKGMDILTWSQDSREIAFNASEGSSKLDIYRIGRGGEGLARVTLEPGDDVEARWSPDRRHFVYTRVGGGRTEVAVIPATGGIPRVVSEEGRLSEAGPWAPGSDRVAYVTVLDDGSFEIWTVPVASPEHRRLVLASKDTAWPLFWSRDGRSLILARGKGPDWRFTAIPVEGGAETEIGKEVPLPSGRGAICDFNAQGEAYRDLFYPGGGIILADGKASADLYMIRARDLERARLVAARREASR